MQHQSVASKMRNTEMMHSQHDKKEPAEMEIPCHLLTGHRDCEGDDATFGAPRNRRCSSFRADFPGSMDRLRSKPFIPG